MDLTLPFDAPEVQSYKSNSQQVRVATESWVRANSYCPNCGQPYLSQFPNNSPVADFYCSNCSEEFELKSKGVRFSNIINDGAYHTMIERLQADNNPNFFFLTYSRTEKMVNNFLIIPKHFFRPDIVIKRSPLKETARRAGWVGCNLDISKVPEAGKVFLVKNRQILSRNEVQSEFHKTLFLRKSSREARGWTLEVMTCLDRIAKREFSLQDVYAFEEELQMKFPNNHFIKDKLRQQLQVLRDQGLIEFLGRGQYRKRL